MKNFPNKDISKDELDVLDAFLPFGEYMRILGTQSAITQGEIKKVLRQRGVIFGNSSKEKMIPYLANILLSPTEFNYLKECFNIREDTEKVSSSTPVNWTSKQNIRDCIPRSLDFDSFFSGRVLNYNLKQTPSYRIGLDKETAIIDFEIERRDRNKSFIEQKTAYKGSVTVQIKDGKLGFITTTTSPETKDVAQYIQSQTAKSLREKGCIEKEKIHKLKFCDFDNIQRWIFLWKLSRDNDSVYFTFNDVVDINFTPDIKKEKLPKDILWMEKQKSLTMKGEDIHSVFFIKNTEYYNHLIVCEIEVEFKYKFKNRSGSCIFSFGFPEYNGRSKINIDAEFEMKIVKLTSDDKLDTNAKKLLNTNLLREMDMIKTKVYSE